MCSKASSTARTLAFPVGWVRTIIGASNADFHPAFCRGALQIFLNEIAVGFGHAPFRKSRQMRTGVASQGFTLTGIVNQSGERTSERARIVIRKCYAAWAYCFRYPALIGTPYGAAAGNPFQTDNPKWLWPPRWHNQDTMVIENFRELQAVHATDEFHRSEELV